jgi:hypothetical protein
MSKPTEGETPEVVASLTTDKGGYEYGPLDTYEITWMSGHIETIRAHQVSYSGRANMLFGGVATDQGASCIEFHGCINRRWCLVLRAREEDIRSVRLVTGGEVLPS